MKDWLEILFYVCAITGSLSAGVRYGYKFLRKKALQETRLSPQSTIEKELRILNQLRFFDANIFPKPQQIAQLALPNLIFRPFGRIFY